jgi:hypothetical protein
MKPKYLTMNQCGPKVVYTFSGGQNPRHNPAVMLQSLLSVFRDKVSKFAIACGFLAYHCLTH